MIVSGIFLQDADMHSASSDVHKCVSNAYYNTSGLTSG